MKLGMTLTPSVGALFPPLEYCKHYQVHSVFVVDDHKWVSNVLSNYAFQAMDLLCLLLLLVPLIEIANQIKVN
jgi:hypothetical protein